MYEGHCEVWNSDTEVALAMFQGAQGLIHEMSGTYPETVKQTVLRSVQMGTWVVQIPRALVIPRNGSALSCELSHRSGGIKPELDLSRQQQLTGKDLMLICQK